MGHEYTKRGARVDGLLAAVAAILAFAVYVRSLAPGLLWGDGAEFQFAAWLGGFVHPTGYPLYLILGWLWTHLLPFGDPAFRMNLFSAVWGALAAGLLALLLIRIVRLMGGSSGMARVAGVGAALVFTFTPTLWSQAVVAEVYTLHATFVAAILLALVTWAERVWAGDETGAAWQWIGAALLTGFSLTHHRTTLLLLPAAIVFAVTVLLLRRRNGAPVGAGIDSLRSRRMVAVSLAGLLAPLLLYLYIPLRAPHAPYADLMLTETRSLPLYDATLSGFIAHVAGSVFRSALGGSGGAGNMGALPGRFIDEVSLNGILLGGLGVLWLAAQALVKRNAPARALLALTTVFFAVQVAFNAFYAIGDIYVFYIPAYLIWVIWLALGAYALASGIRWLLGERWGPPVGTVAIAAVLLALVYRGAVTQWPRVQRAADTSARDAWTALLAADPAPGALLLSNDRDEMTPLWYLKYVEGRRPDLDGLFPLIHDGPEWATIGRAGDQALATGRPVYLVKPMPGLEVKFDPGRPVGERRGGLGPLVRIAPLRGETGGGVAPVAVFGDAMSLNAVRVEPQPLVPAGVLTVTLEWQPAREVGEDWTTFVQVLNANDEKVGQSDHKPGGIYYPSSLWQSSDRLQDVHEIKLASSVGAGPYRLIAGLYINEGGKLRHLGDPTVVAELP